MVMRGSVALRATSMPATFTSGARVGGGRFGVSPFADQPNPYDLA